MRCISFVAVASLALFAVALSGAAAQVAPPVPGEPQAPAGGMADPAPPAPEGGAAAQEGTVPEPPK
ncbi:hypothetical protein IWQ62_000330 [Dispira parvispora]|uniref:Uncharacterized protein n=1 Tax=Dispira parvispora TaxID=1520584 RepID=A0A9W8B0C1_9FUNG|nr:hypothetical protein IWQ62_000330 [Dispira parvispora]